VNILLIGLLKVIGCVDAFDRASKMLDERIATFVG